MFVCCLALCFPVSLQTHKGNDRKDTVAIRLGSIGFLCELCDICNWTGLSRPAALVAGRALPFNFRDIFKESAHRRQSARPARRTLFRHAPDMLNDRRGVKGNCVFRAGNRGFRVMPVRAFGVGQPVREFPRAFEQRFEQMPPVLV